MKKKATKEQSILKGLFSAMSDSMAATVESITLSVKLSAKEKQKVVAKKKAKLLK